MTQQNVGSTLAGFLAGAVIGAGLALIYAPLPGEETRRQLREGAQRVRHRALDRLGLTRDRLELGVDEVSSAIEAGRDAFRRSAVAPGGSVEGA